MMQSSQGTLDFKSVDKITFVGASSNTVIDTTTGSVGVGVDANGPTSNLHVVGNAYVSTDLTVTGDINFFGTFNQNGAPFASSPWTTTGSDLSYTTGNVTIGPIQTFVVTVQQVNSVDKYFINGVDRPILQLYQDQTYIFDLSSSTLVPHPFRFSETNTNDGTSTGTPYTTGITGTEERTFVVPTGAPTTLYYYCENHGGMGSTASISPAVDLMLKGNVAVTGTGSLTVPSGTTEQRPTGVSGMIRYNSTLYHYEAWVNAYGNQPGEWKPLSSERKLYTMAFPFTFTNAGATGRTGPTIVQLTTAYSEAWTENPNYLNVTGTYGGIQEWTVPRTGSYRIEAFGAKSEWGDRSGSSSYRGGYGARMRGEFTLTEGEIIQILVGQNGVNATHTQNTGQPGIGAGGGGTFVMKTPYNTTASILVIAGGGGGGAQNSWTNRRGEGGNTGTSGTGGGSANNSQAGGSGGNGGSSQYAGGGAGFTGNGANPSASTDPSRSFTNGGRGGQGGRSHGGPEFYGGFGGGGGAGGLSSGGGGGYSGGGSGSWSDQQDGGGGGSYNSGTNQSNTADTNDGHGKVIITRLE